MGRVCSLLHPPSGGWWRRLGALTVLLLGWGGLHFSRTAAVPTAPPYVATLSGQTTTARSSPPGDLPIFVPTSVFRLEITPGAQQAGAPPLVARVYRVRSDDRLTLVPVAVVRRDGPGPVVTFTIEAPATEVFYPVPGIQDFWIALGQSDSLVTRHEGERSDSATREPDIDWVFVQAKYELRDDWLGFTLFGHAFVQQTPDGSRPCFTNSESPRVRVEGTSTGDWQLLVTIEGQSRRVHATTRVLGTGILLGPADPVSFAPGDGAVAVLLDGVEVRSWPVCWDVAPSQRPGVFDVIQLRESGQIQEGLRRVRAHLSTADPVDRLWLTVEKGKLLYRSQQFRLASVAWSQAVEMALDVGIPSAASARLRTLAHLEIHERRYESAKIYVDRATEIDTRLGDTLALARDAFSRGALLKRRGLKYAFLEARHLYSTARKSALSIGHELLARDCAAMEGTLLAEHGHYDQALELMEAFPVPSEDNLGAALHLSNRAWVRMKAMQNGYLPLDPEQMRTERHEALRAVEAHAAPQVIFGEQSRMALVALRSGHLDEAQAIIDKLRSASEAERGWDGHLVTLVGSELDIRAGRTEAAERELKQLEFQLRGEAVADSDLSLAARVLRGDNSRVAGDFEAAWGHYKLALQEARRLAQRFVTPRSVGRHYFQGTHLLQGAVLTLLELSRAEEAFELVDTHRAEMASSLTSVAPPDITSGPWRSYLSTRERLAGEFPRGCAGLTGRRATLCSGLEAQAQSHLHDFYRRAAVAGQPQPSPSRAKRGLLPRGAVFLSVFGLPNGQWASWLVSRDELVHAVVADPVAYWLPRLTQATHVIVSPGGHRAAFDLAVRTMEDGRRFGARTPTTLMHYLGLLGGESPDAGEGHDVLIVADPESNLPHARLQASQVAAQFPDATLLVGAQAQQAVVRSGWRRANRLVFLGHGQQDHTGFRSAIRLADGEIVAEDILAERPQFRVAVLAGCRTGRDSKSLPGGALVTALTATGTRYLLTTTEDLRDDNQFALRFIEHAGLESPVEAYRRTLEEFTQTGEEEGGIPYRLWGPPK